MSFISTLPICLSLFFCLFYTIHAANFDIVNQCSYTVWAAASLGGGRQLDSGQTWSISVASGTTMARIWGRTKCTFDANGQGKCETGDCNGLLECQVWGSPPNTLAEFALNQFNSMDFPDISLVDGFNIPMDFSPTNNNCHDIRCTSYIFDGRSIQRKPSFIIEDSIV